MEITDHGIIIRGSFPASQIGTIQAMAKAFGFDLIDAGLGRALGACMVITNSEGSAFMRAYVEKSNKDKSLEDAWICGCDTGTSSKTIFSVMRGCATSELVDVPRDPGDFGRCYRLLALIPAWRMRLGEVALKYPKWKPMVEAWDELTELYEEEIDKDSAPKLYARMQELRR